MMSKWCVRDSAGGREEEEEEEEKAAGYRTKTRTPHKDVGKNDFSIFLSIVIVFFQSLLKKNILGLKPGLVFSIFLDFQSGLKKINPGIETGLDFFQYFWILNRIEKSIRIEMFNQIEQILSLDPHSGPLALRLLMDNVEPHFKWRERFQQLEKHGVPAEELD